MDYYEFKTKLIGFYNDEKSIFYFGCHPQYFISKNFNRDDYIFICSYVANNNFLCNCKRIKNEFKHMEKIRKISGNRYKIYSKDYGKYIVEKSGPVSYIIQNGVLKYQKN